LTQPMRVMVSPELELRGSPQRWVRWRVPRKSRVTMCLLYGRGE
jgi:hypothetical protein